MNKNKNVWLIIAVVTLVGAFILLYLTFFLHNTSITTPKGGSGASTHPASGNQNIKLSPPSQQDKQEASNIKQGIVTQSQPPSSPPKMVIPLITSAAQYADQIEVRAIVNGVYESGGTCTATFMHNDLSFTKTTGADKDATTTVCAPLIVPVSAFQQAGTWTVSLKYDSTGSHGVSESKQIEVR